MDLRLGERSIRGADSAISITIVQGTGRGLEGVQLPENLYQELRGVDGDDVIRDIGKSLWKIAFLGS